MDQTLSNALTSALNGLADAAKATSNFAQAQIPDVLHQFLVMKALENLGSMIGTIVFGIVAAVGFRWAWKLAAKTQMHHTKCTKEGYVILCAIIGVVVCADASLLIHTGVQILEIWLAPKAYLVQFAATLISSTGK